MARPNPRKANGSLRAKRRREMAALGLPCAICGGRIDYSLPARHPLSFELDEIVPVSRWWRTGFNRRLGVRVGPYPDARAAAEDPANHQPAHRICNERKGNRSEDELSASRPKPPPETSREW